MTALAPEAPDARPPTASHAAPSSGAAPSPTLRRRPFVAPVIERPRRGVAPDDPYVRRFWVAVLGPGAVADLLRLIAAARRGRRIRMPVHLGVLLEARLARRGPRGITVPILIPTVPPSLERRMPPSLRVEHRRVIARALRHRDGPPGGS